MTQEQIREENVKILSESVKVLLWLLGRPRMLIGQEGLTRAKLKQLTERTVELLRVYGIDTERRSE